MSVKKIEQKSIESFFQDYGVVNPDLKVKILPEITDLIYDYNLHVRELEKINDEYKQQQILTDIKEIEAKIISIIKEYKQKYDV